MNKLIVVTGADLTGKTTLIELLQASRDPRAQNFHAFRCPHFHENPDSPVSELSQVIMNLGKQADQEKNGLLKAIALFLGMTLYGRVQQDLELRFPGKILVSERHPLTDSLAYRSIYGPLLQKIQKNLAPVSADGISLLQGQVAKIAPGHTLESFGFFLRDLFAQDIRKLTSQIESICQVEIPKGVFLLTSSADTFQQRLGERGALTEYHESVSALLTLQGAFQNACKDLKHMDQNLRFLEQATDETNPESCLSALFSAFATHDKS